MSAPSGVSTFRDKDGLWAKYRIEEVATPEAFAADPAKVLDFYNQRRAQLDSVEPNDGHRVIAEWERDHEVVIITQNVDNLHERAGSSNVLHLHGELTKARSSTHPDYVVDIGTSPIRVGDLCPKGGQMRPHIVWFGEMVTKMEEAFAECLDADVFIVVGTSLSVYPAAGLAGAAPDPARKIYIDPDPEIEPPGFDIIRESADIGLQHLARTIHT